MSFSKSGVLFAACILFLTACSERLTGTWTVQRYEIVVPGQQTLSFTNIGTMTFKDDHTGTRSVHYSVLGQQRDDTSGFSWSYDNTYVTIQSNDSDFAKTWVIKDDNKNLQRWQSTNGRGQVQLLELKR